MEIECGLPTHYHKHTRYQEPMESLDNYRCNYKSGKTFFVMVNSNFESFRLHLNSLHPIEYLLLRKIVKILKFDRNKFLYSCTSIF